jgi:hypothetical protein
MVTLDEMRSLACSYEGVEEMPHFETTSFRYRGRIFATYRPDLGLAMLRLTPVDQSVFCGYDANSFSPVPNAWGTKGATYVDLRRVRKAMFKDALQLAFDGVAKSTSRRRKP